MEKKKVTGVTILIGVAIFMFVSTITIVYDDMLKLKKFKPRGE